MLTGDFKNNVLPLNKKLLRLACQMLQDDEEAKDVLQDIFLRLWQKRDELDRIDNIEAFATRMMRNRCLDLIKSRQTRRDAINRVSTDNGETDHLENADSADLVKRIIARLPDPQKTIINLKDIELLDYEEIAELTDMNINAIRVNLSRARKRVRDEIFKIENYGITENKDTAAKVL